MNLQTNQRWQWSEKVKYENSQTGDRHDMQEWKKSERKMDGSEHKGENSGHKFTDWKKTGNGQNKKTKKQLWE